MTTKKEVFGIELKHYLKANKEEKGKILDGLERQTDMNRKAIIRKFRREQLRRPCDGRKRGKKLYYTADVTCALKYVWEITNELCGELVHPIINEYIDILMKADKWNHDEIATGKLRSMSEGTVKDRVSKFMKARTPRKGKSTTNPSAIKEIIPVFCGPWDDVPTGHGQIDTVVHCGSTLAGNMVFSLSYTDVYSGWWEGRAQLNKGMERTRDNLSFIKKNILIPWFHAHPDCGSEFLNEMVIDWTKDNNMKFTRSRSYHKNDNAYVEQKNGHIIRKTLGYSRLDTDKVVPMVNELFRLVALHRNYFIPQRKLISKERNGAKNIKKYDKAKTPFKRVLADPTVSKEVKDKITKIYEENNPLDLKLEIDKLIIMIFKLQKQHGDPNF